MSDTEVNNAEKLLDPALFDDSHAGNMRVNTPAGGFMPIGVRTFRAPQKGSNTDNDGNDDNKAANNLDDQQIPLILVHAFPVDGRMWATSVHFLTQMTSHCGPELANLPIFGFDVPGVKGVPLPTAEQTGAVDTDGGYRDAFDRLTDTLVAQLHELGFQRAIWAGLSMGGYLVLNTVCRHSDAVAGLALCDSNPFADDQKHRANRLALASRAAGNEGPAAVMHFATPAPHDSALKKSAAYRDLFIRWINSQPGEGLAWRERMAAGRADTSQALQEVTRASIPTLFISGQRDPSSGPDVMRPLAHQVSGSLFVEIPDAGHFTAVERPQQFAQALVSLLVRVVCEKLGE